MRNAWMAIAVVALIGGVAAAARQEASPQASIQVSPGDVKWMDGPPSLPPGAKFALLSGDTKKDGLFVMRLKLPADYKIPPHSHPGDEHVTVLSGAIHVSMGDAFDPVKAKSLGAGSYALLPGRNNHFAFFKEETILQLNSMGPWDITYANPADDPRKKK